MSNLLECYIDSLIHTIEKPIAKKYNLVIDGGGFNGAFVGGCLYYLYELEKLKLITINKISGCSVGALLGYMYLTNSLEYLPIYYERLLSNYRNYGNLKVLKKIIIEHVKKTDYRLINKKLFITYYNINTRKQHVVSEYNSETKIIKCLIKSTFVPFLINGSLGYKEKKNLYCDGFSPFIFNFNRKNTIFISLITFKFLKHSFYTYDDVTIWEKLLDGIKDIHLFFSNGMASTKYCSLINQWSYCNFIKFTFREIFIKVGIKVLQSMNSTNIQYWFKDFYKLFLKNIHSYKIS
jgi:hypothetical protein